MKVPVFRAKDRDSDRYYEGFYFAYPETTYCFSNDYANGKVKLIHCIVTHRMTDWGLPNQPVLVTIDIETLEQIGEVDSSEMYYSPNEYMNKVIDNN